MAIGPALMEVGEGSREINEGTDQILSTKYYITTKYYRNQCLYKRTCDKTHINPHTHGTATIPLPMLKGLHICRTHGLEVRAEGYLVQNQNKT